MWQLGCLVCPVEGFTVLLDGSTEAGGYDGLFGTGDSKMRSLQRWAPAILAVGSGNLLDFAVYID